MRRLLRLLLFTFVLRPGRKASWLAMTGAEALLRRTAKFYERYTTAVTKRFSDLDFGTRRTAMEKLIGVYYASLPGRIAMLAYKPVVSVVVPVYKVRPEHFRETLASVATQIYDRWELCIVDDASGDPKIGELVGQYAAAFPGKVKFAVNEKNQHISETSNRALALATGDYVALLDHDDILLPNALAEMVRFVNLRERPEVLYSDERVAQEDGSLLHGPFFKPAWSPLLSLSVNYTTHLSVYSRELLQKIGGFRRGYEGSQDHDLMLRAVEMTSRPVAHVPFVLYQWRAVAGSTAASVDEKPYAVVNGIKAVGEACARRGYPAEVDYEKKTFHYRVKFNLPSPQPLVSIIIPTKDRRDLLEPCIESIFAKSTYKNVEVIVVDNGTTEASAAAYLDGLATRFDGRVRVIRDPSPFNFGALNNRAAAEAKGEYLVCLNNDTVVIAPEWLEEMLRLAQLPEVGAVGCKLLYPDGRLQHAGIVLLGNNVAGHALRLLSEDTDAYIAMAQTVHECSAVTAACLMVAKKKFDAVRGFDDVFLANGFGDVDLCLKLNKAGYQSVYTPYAVLTHYESPSRGRGIETLEKKVMFERWGRELMNDPYLNPNFLRHEHYAPIGEDSLDASRALLHEWWKDKMPPELPR